MILEKWDGEVGKKFQFTVKDNGSVVDITGSTVELVVKGGSVLSCTITDASNGKADYTTTASDITIGAHDVQIKVTTGASDIFYSAGFSIEVKDNYEA